IPDTLRAGFDRLGLTQTAALLIFWGVWARLFGRSCRPDWHRGGERRRSRLKDRTSDEPSDRGYATAATARLQRGPGAGGWHGILGARPRCTGPGGRRGVFQYLDHRLSGDPDRSVLCRP